MKLYLCALLFAGFGLAQTSVVIRVTEGGVESVAKVSGVPAVAALDVLRQWMATQSVCDTAQDCKAKYANLAELVKALTLDTAEQLAPQYPSALLKADVEEAKAKQASIEAKRRAAFAAARSEKP